MKLLGDVLRPPYHFGEPTTIIGTVRIKIGLINIIGSVM